MTGALCRHPPMAVRTADLALADLLSDRGETASVPRELRHRRALRSDVVELEDNGMALSAVDARMLAQDLEEVGDVPRGVPIHAWPCRGVRPRGASPAAAYRGPAPMA